MWSLEVCHGGRTAARASHRANESAHNKINLLTSRRRNTLSYFLSSAVKHSGKKRCSSIFFDLFMSTIFFRDMLSTRA